MAIFAGVKHLFLLLGYFPFNHPENRRLNIFSKVLCFCSVVPVSISSLFYFLYGGRTFAERTESFFNFNISSLLFVAYFILLLRRQTVLDLIECFESTIEERK